MSAELAALRAENEALRQDASELAGAFWRLDEYRYFGTEVDDEREQCWHWMAIARDAAERIRAVVTKPMKDAASEGK